MDKQDLVQEIIDCYFGDPLIADIREDVKAETRLAVNKWMYMVSMAGTHRSEAYSMVMHHQEYLHLHPTSYEFFAAMQEEGWRLTSDGYWYKRR